MPNTPVHGALLLPFGAAGGNSTGASAPSRFAGHPYKPLTHFPPHRDALSTIMQWLHSRIPHTR